MSRRVVPTTVVLWCAVVALCMAVGCGAQKGYTICDVQGCNCTPKAPNIPWMTVGCELHEQQELNLQSGHIPKEVLEMSMKGGRSVSFSAKTFSSLEAFTFLRLESTKIVTVDKRAFCNITSSSLLIQIQGCDRLTLRKGAFENVLSTLSVEAIDIKYVSLESAPFSKLYNGTFYNIGKMDLTKGTFEFRNIGKSRRHGPVTVLLFVNAYIPTLPREVFYSSLAAITLINCTVGVVETRAFKANEISAVSLINSSFDVIEETAVADWTRVVDFKIVKCTIGRMQSKAIMAGISNLTVNHSVITELEPRAIKCTVAKVEIIGNHIFNLHSYGFNFYLWNTITIDDNIIKDLHTNFIEAPIHSEMKSFSFKGNEVRFAKQGSLSFVPKISRYVLLFDDNYFNESCSCEMEDWANTVANGTENIDLIIKTSFCTVNKLLSECFSLPTGIINMYNFTEKACQNKTECKPYNGEIKTVDTTSKIYLEPDDSEKQSWLILIITVIGLFIIALVVTFVVLLVRGSRWLKRKGYFHNHRYSSNNHSNEDEENTIVTMDENEKLDIPEELTVEFLQELSRRLDDPATHQEASEMIERLYEMFVVDDSYENNNRQDEEAHLYEELGNLNLQIPPPPYEEQPKPQPAVTNPNGPRGILRIMEEKFNASNADLNGKPALAGDYSEPTDAAVHLYSELRQKAESGNSGTTTSNKSGNIALRPLPDKPENRAEPGPSSLS